MTKSPVPKIQFRIYKLKDGRVLAENPYRIDENRNQPSTMMVITEMEDKSLKVTVEEEIAVLPTEKDSIISVTDAKGIVGEIELTNGRYLLVITERMLAATVTLFNRFKVTKYGK